MMRLVIVTVVALAAGAGGWAYFHRATPAAPPVPEKKLADWTPEMIVAQPEAYLDFCEAQVTSSLAVLKQRQGAIESAKASFSQQRDRELAVVREAEGVARQLKDAIAANAWPAKLAGQGRNESWIRDNLAQIESQLPAKQKLIATYDDGLARLAAEQARNPGDQSYALQQLAEIRTSREFLKINKMNDDYSKRLVEMRSMVQGVIASAEQPAGVVRLEDLTNKPR
jgi:hypothetical protein